MQSIIVLTLLCAAVSATSVTSPGVPRIIGGSPTTIDNYPSTVAYLRAHDSINFLYICGGAILNERTILTAAHCDMGGGETIYRLRVGSSFSNSGGVVYNIARIINHPNYSEFTFDSDIAILHTASHVILSDVAQQATIAGPNFQVGHGEVVWAAGWGLMEGMVQPEQLRHVALGYISQEHCRDRIFLLNDNMLCAGSLNFASAGQCSGDSGSPLYFRNIVVGVCSFTFYPCGRPDSASVSARVSRYTNWILENAFT